MTESDRLHLVEQLGAIMDASEQGNASEHEQDHGVSIHIHSPGNRVVNTHDFIEININLGAGSHCEVRDRSLTAIGDTSPGK